MSNSKAITPDYVIEAEKDLIGQVMLDPQCHAEADLAPGVFAKYQHNLIWECASELISESKEVSPISIADKLEERGKLSSCGGLAGLSKFIVEGPSMRASVQLAGLVRDNFLKRETFKAVAAMEQDHFAGYNGSKMYERMLSRMEELSDIQSVVRPNMRQDMARELANIRQDIADGKSGIAGLPLDDLGLGELVPTGLPLDKVTVIAGATGNFKTTLAFNFMDCMAKAGPVLLLSLEDSTELTRQCALARLTGIPYARIINRDLTSREVDEIEQALGKKSTKWLDNIIAVGDFHPSVDEVIRLARQYKRSHGILGVILDYVQLLDTGDSNQAFGIAAAAKKMQLAAHRDDLAYVVLSQVNTHKLVTRGDHRPQLGDLFGSSGLAQSCKLCLTTYKPSRVWHNPEAALEEDNKTQYAYIDKEYCSLDPETYESVLEVWVRKSRAGVVDKHTKLKVDLSTGKTWAGVL